MLMWLLIITLVAVGLALIIVEVIFIPGTTVVGVLGVVFTIVGIVVSYRHFGNDAGFYVLLGSLMLTLAALFFSFRYAPWSRFSLKSAIESKVNEGMLQDMKIGEEGTAITTLRPVGKAEFSTGQFEVRAVGKYVEKGTRIQIKTIESNQIVVEPIV
jgi:membrane-bound ClpP family serine protease